MNLQTTLGAISDTGREVSFDTSDTRTFLYTELFRDLTPAELLYGRGFLGTYFSEYINELSPTRDDAGDFYQRFGSEVGLLQLLLKGGLVYYLL